MTCKICQSTATEIFKARVLNQFNVAYFQCVDCLFIQTETPYWLNEAYQTAITVLDVGLIYRNIKLSQVLETVLLNNRSINPNGKFIDFGGGYGIFVRLMRDKGFDFYRQDIHCENLFAKCFDIADISDQQQFELLSSIEVFEHLEDPIKEFAKMLSFSDKIFFTTELLPNNNPTPASWWYFAPETGQHISFYSRRSLEILAEKFKLNFYSNGSTMHMFSKTKLDTDPFQNSKNRKKLINYLPFLKSKTAIDKRESLLMKDFEFIRSQINIKTTEFS